MSRIRANAVLLVLIVITIIAPTKALQCPDLNEHLSLAELNMAWICELLNWRNTLANLKTEVELHCVIGDVEERWHSSFSCPDFSNITCMTDSAPDIKTDFFNCSIIFCKDGLYADQGELLRIWKQHFNQQKNIMDVSKAISCKSKCPDSTDTPEAASSAMNVPTAFEIFESWTTTTRQTSTAELTTADIDECESGSHKCDESATCANSVGSYDCTCNTGFSGDGQNCSDIDECASGSNKCAENTTCTNNEGSYECTCSTGFTGEGQNCTDIDECVSGSQKCDQNATCTNNDGSYDCRCNTGFTGDGLNCSDINECVSGCHKCDENATCTDNLGSYDCTCNTGFTGDRHNCSDIDECTSGSHKCDQNATCTNNAGSYDCTCNIGFIGDGQKCDKPQSCDDVTLEDAEIRDRTGGIFDIDLGGNGVVMEVYCDLETDGGNWTVFQRREDGSVDFFRNWDDYVNGFGNVSGEFWLGLDKIRRVFEDGGDFELRIDMIERESGKVYFAKYGSFSIGNADIKYRLHVTGYTGNATDSMAYHNGHSFSTRDHDNDPTVVNCAQVYKGGWWYTGCYDSNLNALYGILDTDGVAWRGAGRQWVYLSYTEMKLRRKQ